MEWVVLFIIIVVLGALVGGNSFGETIRNGIGCLMWIFLALLALVVFVVFISAISAANLV